MIGKLFIFEGINQIAEKEQCAKPESLEAIFTHKLMPKDITMNL
jgi:hypothetical protein